VLSVVNPSGGAPATMAASLLRRSLTA
jgi:hypothetical protein